MAQAPIRPEQPGGSPPPMKRRSWLGLIWPYILLLAVAVLWSAGWFYVRARAGSEMDRWLAREAEAGRTWTCADRSIAGYPFRIELRCSAVRFARADSRFAIGPVTAVVQVYQPRHVVFEATGPFTVEQGDLAGDLAWTRLEGSLHALKDGFTRASLVAEAPRIRVTGAGPEPVTVAARHLELHARPTPGRFESDGAVDLSVSLAQAEAPMADAFVGNRAPADLALEATINRATILRTGAVARELETWRRADGSLEIGSLSIVKGDRRLQAKGTLAIDAAHRPEGQLDVRAAGLEALVGGIVGQRFGADRGALVGNLIGGLLGARRPKDADPTQSPEPGETALKTLPPIRLVDGRLLFAGFPIPNVRLPVLY